MGDIRFEWDEIKNDLNRLKHGIDFNEAYTVFFDDNAITIQDEEHSALEDRFLILGLSERLKLMVVCHCFRESDSVIRIISARKATNTEAKQYGERVRWS